MIRKIKEIGIYRYNKHKQFLLYGIFGISGALLDLIIFTILFNFFNIDKNTAKIISTTCGITNTFILNVLFNFKVNDNILKRFVAYYSIGILGLLLALLLFNIFVDKLKFNTNLINLISIPLIVLLQYNLNKLISFRKKKNANT